MDERFEDLGPVTKKLTITVGVDAVRRKLDETYAQLKRDAKLPGFRRGKVPRQVLEEHFGAEAVAQAAAELVREHLPAALAARRLELADEPAVTLGRLRLGKPFEFCATLELRPVVELGDLGALCWELDHDESADVDVDGYLESMRRQLASLVEAADGWAIGSHDVADVKLTLRSEGYPDHELDMLRVGLPEDASADFVRELVLGLRRGESRSGPVAVPMAYPDPIWAGARCEATVEVHGVLRVELPELDDALAQRLGQPTLAALRAAVSDQLRTAMRERARARAERRLVEQLVDAHPFEVPRSMIERRASVLVRAIAAELIPGSANQQPTLEDLEDDKREDVLREAEFAVRRELVLDAVARREGLAVTDDDRTARIAAIATQMHQPVEHVRSYLQDGGKMASVDARILEDKALALLVERARQG